VDSDPRSAASRPDLAEFIKAYFDGETRVVNANKALLERHLIKLTPHGSERHVCGIELTIDGYDLGRKYSSWLIWTGLCFAEYRHHWLWVIGAFVFGILGTLLVQWLSASLWPSPK
jgi:hypothetical protein